METTKEPYISNYNASDNWISSLLKETKRANEDFKQVFIVTIARKMARLYEYYREIDSRLLEVENGFNDIHNEIITEHALPFCLNGKNPKDTQVIIVDDFIVFGDTVETVAQNVFALTGIRPKIIAIAAYDSIYKSFLWGELVYPLPGSSDIIGKEDIPAYTARNSWKILSLKKPIDLEHTILKVGYEGISEMDLNSRLCKSLKECFPEADVYSVVHNIPGNAAPLFNISVCFNGNIGEGINNDFNKLRFFIRPNQVEIVSFAPNIWEGDILDADTVHFNSSTVVEECWENVRNFILDVGASAIDIPVPVQHRKTSIREDLLIRKELSAVILSNYFLSFVNSIKLKDKTKKALSQALDKDVRLDLFQNDLTLLVGESMGSILLNRLRPLIDLPEQGVEISRNRSQFSEEFLHKPLVPEDKSDIYKKKNLFDVYFSRSTNAALALMFNNMWQLFGLIPNRNKEDRVRVGETYDSLYKAIRMFYKHEDILKEIHRWIDSRIDLGIVVPKYEYTVNRLGKRIWRRYFRAGEREDLMTDIAKAAYCISVELFSENEIVTFDDFKTKVAEKLSILDSQYAGQVNAAIFTQGLIRPKNSDSDIFNLWIYMILIEYFNLTSTNNWLQIRINRQADGSLLVSNSAIVTLPIL